MKVLINIKDEKFDFMMEVLKNFKFVKVITPRSAEKTPDENKEYVEGGKHAYQYQRSRFKNEPKLPVEEKKLILPDYLTDTVEQISQHRSGKTNLKSANDLLNEL